MLLVVCLVTPAMGQVSTGQITNEQIQKAADADDALEQLARLKVVSVSRREVSLQHAAAAVFVITHEDIRRSGLQNIPELLRMAPGLDVARIDGNKWAVSARGFNERFADKMLVMIDGRSVLSPLSSGVYWDVQDTVVEDIERIEVVRGPGATLWGANAVNGVVNIITRKAADTQGGLISVTAGSEGQSSSYRYGGTLGQRGHYRVYARTDNTRALTDAAGDPGADSFGMTRGGFRADWELSKRTGLTVQGDLYQGNAGQTTEGLVSLDPPASGTFENRTKMAGGNLLARWQHTSSSRFDTTIQLYADVERRAETGVLEDHRLTTDFEIVQHYAAGRGHDLSWGGDYRHDADDTLGSANISFNPAKRGTNLAGVFLQDELMLLPEKLWVTIGSKLEHNSYSGFALQPNVRVLLAPGKTQALWAAVSHAAENSARFDADIQTNEPSGTTPGGVPVVTSSFGVHVLPAENVTAYEAGYRKEFKRRFSIDTAAFFNRYSKRHTYEPGIPYLEGSVNPYLVMPLTTAYKISGHSQGGEVSATASVSAAWRVVAGYTFLQTHVSAAADSLDFTTATETNRSSPRHQFVVRSMVNLSRRLQLDSALYFVGQVPGPEIPRYARVDVRAGWRFSDSAELSLGARNLLDPRHFEFGSGDFVNATQVGRSVYARLVWRH